VLQELIPSHHTWCRVGCDKSWALSTLGVCADFFAHVLADACKLVLECDTCLGVCCNTRLFVSRCNGLGVVCLEELGCLGMPAFDLALAPLHQIVHVLKELIPCHDTWSRIRSHKTRALRTLWVGTHLFAHVLADASHLVLHCQSVLEVRHHT